MRKIKKHLGLTESRYKTFKAMMSISIVVFLICAILFVIYFQKLRTELNDNFIEFNNYLDSIVETQFQNSLNYSTSVILDPANQKIVDEAYSQVDLYNYSIRLNNFVTTNPLVNTLFVYYPKLDLVICNYGVYSLKEFYLSEYGYSNKDLFQEWKSEVIDNFELGFSYNTNFEDTIYYTRLSDSKDKNKNQRLRQLIFISFDLGQLSFDDNKSVVDEFGFIIDENLILLKSNNNSIVDFLSDNGEKVRNNFLIDVKDNIIYKNQLPYSNITLITSMSLASYNESMRFLIIAAILTLLVSGIFSLSYSLRASKNVLQPFRDLATRISSSKSSRDSLMIINEKIDNLLEEESYKEEMIQKQYYEKQNIFLANLFMNNNADDDFFNTLINEYDIVFPYTNFLVLYSKDKNLSQLIKKSVNYMFVDMPLQFNIVEIDSYLIGVINFEEDDALKNNIILETEAFLRYNSFDLNNILFSISDIVLTFSDLPYALAQCKYLLNKNNHYSIYYDQSLIIVHDLKKAFDNEDVKLFQSCIYKVFANNTYMPSILLKNLFKVIKQYDKNIEFNYENYEKVNIKDILPIINNKEKSQESYNTLIDKIDNIIDRSYRDVNLGLYTISEELNVSNTYISTIYKEYYGIGIVNQINKKRIEWAKHQLLNTNKSVKEVAIEAGFASDITFIRVFKKIEELTPGKLRKINK